MLRCPVGERNGLESVGAAGKEAPPFFICPESTAQYCHSSLSSDMETQFKIDLARLRAESLGDERQLR